MAFKFFEGKKMNQRKIGAILSYISLAANSCIGLIYIPLLLYFLTKEQYGLYQLIGAMIAYLGTMDFGLANTTTRYYSGYLATGEKEKQQNLLATMGILYSFIALGIILVGLIMFFALLPFYANTLSAGELITAKWLFLIMLFNMSFMIPGNIFVAIINSHEKFVFAKTLSLINIILQPVLVVCALSIKPSVIFIALAQTFCALSAILINVYYSFFRLKVHFKLYKWDNKFVNEILAFSFFIFLIALMDLVYVKTGQVVLGAVMGTAAVAVYSVGIQFLMIYRSMSGAIFSVFLPYFSAKAAQSDDMTEINKTFIKVSRLQFFILSLILCGFILYGKTFILLWVGQDFLPAYIYGILFMAGWLWISSQNAASLIVQAKNKHKVYALIYVFTGVISIIMSVPFAKIWGGIGCVFATIISLLIGQGLLTNIYYVKLGIDIKGYLKNTSKFALSALISLLLGLGLSKLFFPAGICQLLWQIPVFTFIFFIVAWFVVLNNYEKNLMFYTPFNKLKSLRRKK